LAFLRLASLHWVVHCPNNITPLLIFPGEMVDRKYDWSRIPRDSKFGVEMPHNNDGIHVRKTLKWLHETQQ